MEQNGKNCSRLLIIVENKVVVSENKDVLHELSIGCNQSIEEWIKARYNIRVLTIEWHEKWNLYVVNGAFLGDNILFDLASFPSATKKIPAEKTEIIDFLKALRLRSHIKLQFGLRNNCIVSVADLSANEKGLKCGCVCPGCGAPLVARLGEQKQRHFAHQTTNCNIAVAQQTALHMLAKEIIEEEHTLLLPGLEINRNDVVDRSEADDLFYRLPVSLSYLQPKVVRCSEVLLEKRVSDIIPDIVISVNGRKCLVEIAVTHFVDQEKEHKIAQIGLPLLEIDLSNFYNSDFSKAAIRQAVLSESGNRKWIYNPKRAEAMDWAKGEYESRLRAARKEEAEQQKRYEAKLEKKEQKRERAEKLLQEQFRIDTYKNRLLALRNDQITNQALSQRRFFRECNNQIPFFVDIPITGEIIFPCDRRVWQSAVFDKFVYNRAKSTDTVTVSVKRINAWLKDYQSEIPIAWELASKAYVHLSENHAKNVTLLYDTIATYLFYLSQLGFISPVIYSEAIVKASHTIVPPDEKKATQLQAILKEVNRFDPDIDLVIKQMLSPNHDNLYWVDYDDPAVQRKKAEQRELQDKIRLQTRELGYQQVVNMDFDGCDPIYDKLGYRWLLCTFCNQILRDDDMSSYGGRGSENKGICRSCARK